MHAIYTTQSAAQMALDAVNAAFAATLPAHSVTQRWCDSPMECAEGWAIPYPPEQFIALLGSHIPADSINAADQPLNQTAESTPENL
jgi:hypothetical protein